jgi:hypothetical protein
LAEEYCQLGPANANRKQKEVDEALRVFERRLHTAHAWQEMRWRTAEEFRHHRPAFLVESLADHNLQALPEELIPREYLLAKTDLHAYWVDLDGDQNFKLRAAPYMSRIHKYGHIGFLFSLPRFDPPDRYTEHYPCPICSATRGDTPLHLLLYCTGLVCNNTRPLVDSKAGSNSDSDSTSRSEEEEMKETEDSDSEESEVKQPEAEERIFEPDDDDLIDMASARALKKKKAVIISEEGADGKTDSRPFSVVGIREAIMARMRAERQLVTMLAPALVCAPAALTHVPASAPAPATLDTGLIQLVAAATSGRRQTRLQTCSQIPSSSSDHHSTLVAAVQLTRCVSPAHGSHRSKAASLNATQSDHSDLPRLDEQSAADNALIPSNAAQLHAASANQK